jgi:hypothetical protein
MLLPKLTVSTDISFHVGINIFPMYAIKYISYRKMFQIKVADCNEIYILCHVPGLLHNKPFLVEFLHT